MKRTIFVTLLMMPLALFLFISCQKDKEDPGELSQNIKNLVPDSTFNAIKGLRMPIYRGLEPPNLENTYLASPFTLKSTNIEGDWDIGYVISDYYVRFYDQDDVNLTIKVDYYNGGESGSGLGGYISGSGNKFSVFVVVNSYYDVYPAKLLHVISGVMTADGIKNLYFANTMLNDYGDEGDNWIENNQGRVFYDSDGMSPITDYAFKSTEGLKSTGVSSASKRK
jgi:hypothetical protein